MKQLRIVLITCVLALWLLLLGTNPAKLPSFMLILPFLLLFLILLLAGAFFLRQRGWTKNRSLRIAGLAAALPTLLLILQSIGQLTLRDVVTVFVLFAFSFFYISRSKATTE